MAGIPDYQSLMLPVLEIAAKGETSVPLAEADIATRCRVCEDAGNTKPHLADLM
jgi:hypothetical protein